MTTTWPDRLVGTDRTGDPLLSLDDTAAALRDALMRAQWYTVYLSGTPGCPIHRRWDERHRNPRPGDLVFIPDRILSDRDPDTRLKSFGYLVGEQDEPVYGRDEWQEVEDQYDDDRPCPTERVYYIQYGPEANDVCRWVDADCRTIATREISNGLWRP